MAQIHPAVGMRQIMATELTGAVITAMIDGTDVVRQHLTRGLGYSRNTLKYAELDRVHVRLTRARAESFLDAMRLKGVTAFIDMNENLPLQERAVTVVAHRIVEVDFGAEPRLRQMVARK